MKTLGLVGGTSWASTAEYYRVINQTVHERLGGTHAARLILFSVNFSEFVSVVEQGLPEVERYLSGLAKKLEMVGAEGLVICANTPHIVADGIRKQIGIPIIHIADATAREIQKCGLHTVGLLGTSLTMEDSFYKNYLAGYGIDTVIPDAEDRKWIHGTIFEELGAGIFESATKQRYLRIIEELAARGAQGIVLGCTEIPLLINQIDTTIPLFDTTLIHAHAAVEFALS